MKAKWVHRSPWGIIQWWPWIDKLIVLAVGCALLYCGLFRPSPLAFLQIAVGSVFVLCWLIWFGHLLWWLRYWSACFGRSCLRRARLKHLGFCCYSCRTTEGRSHEMICFVRSAG